MWKEGSLQGRLPTRKKDPSSQEEMAIKLKWLLQLKLK